METSKNLFKELENAEKLFSNGSIKNAQKIIRNVIKDSRSLSKIPNKLRHKLNAAINKSKYFDEISSFATNPKREALISKINKLITNPLKKPKKHAHSIHEIQRQWQLLDISSKPASRSQWLKFNELTNKAWEPCKEYFNEIKKIKKKNAKERENIINEISIYIDKNKRQWPEAKSLINYLRGSFKKWQEYAPVLDEDLNRLRKLYSKVKKPITDEIRNQENLNEEKKEALINKVKEICNDDNNLCINEFKKLKNDWIKIGSAGKNDKDLWYKFNKSADRFFEEKKELAIEEINIIKDLYKQLTIGDKSTSEINKELNKLVNSKGTDERKKLDADISKFINKLKKEKRKEKIKLYKNIYNVLVKKDEISSIPNVFSNSIMASYENTKSDNKELSYACIKLEILAGLDSIKKDKELRDYIQLEMLSLKFNKHNKHLPNDLMSILIHFIHNFSMKDEGKIHQNLWKRISKCFDILI